MQDGYMEIDTKSGDLSALGHEKLVIVTVKAALVEKGSGEEIASETISFQIRFVRLTNKDQ